MTAPAAAGRRPTSIATVSLSGDLAQKLEAIAAAGFDAVEIFDTDLLTFGGQARDVGRAAAALGLRIAALQPFRDYEGLPEPDRARALARASRKFDLMQELGTDLLLVCSSVSPAALGGLDRAAEDFCRLGDLAAERGLRVGYEALAWGRYVNDYRDAWEVVRRAGHPAVGLILDSFHAAARNSPLDPIRAIPGERIFLVQLADAPRLQMDLLTWSRHFRCFPGQGELPVTAFVEAVDATGYSGPFSLEIFNDQFRAGPPEATARDGLRSLIHLDDQARRAEGRAPLLPARAPIARVEFVEFAVDAEAGGELSRLFSALGFDHVGDHHEKAVSRWRQGAINLVINTESDGFAHSHAILHGSGVCALGLAVPDVDAAMARAAGLRATTFHQPAEPAGIPLPAIRGVGGSLLYFLDAERCDEVWDRDFRPVDAATPPGRAVGLTHIDHVSQSMSYEEMLSWILAYTSLFTIQRLPQANVVDPAGLVLSQPLVDPASDVRLVLNATQAQRTLSARFISEHLGSGVQHVAFATSDIFASVARMEANGVKPLAIPDTYYRDLEARFDLDAELMARLRRGNVLYDRDEGGEFFHVYSHVFDRRFFFEVVQRAGSQGFGAANAPVRLAAQTREIGPYTLPRDAAPHLRL